MENFDPTIISRTDYKLKESTDFLDLAIRGRNSWWRYLVSIFMILFVWQIIGAIPYLIVVLLNLSSQPVIAFIAINFSFICLMAGLLFFVWFVHLRNPVSLITGEKRISFTKIWIAAGMWAIIVVITTVLDSLVHPGSYSFTFEWKTWVPFALTAIILTPIQTSAEELLFRGYFLQGLGILTKRKWILTIISGLIFAVPHFLNPEMKYGFVLMALFYFSFGAILTMITLKSNRLEYALGVHAANNLMTVLLANYKDSALPSPSIFTANVVDPVFNLVIFLLGAALLWYWLFKLNPTSVVIENSRRYSE
jgi:membrane protease YdiL (CAAX protease family)